MPKLTKGEANGKFQTRTTNDPEKGVVRLNPSVIKCSLSPPIYPINKTSPYILGYSSVEPSTLNICFHQQLDADIIKKNCEIYIRSR